MGDRIFLPAALACVLAAGAVRAGEPDEAWLRRRVEEVRAADATAWRKIPWAGSLPDARRAGREEKAPVFLFTHDGNIDTGRC